MEKFGAVRSNEGQRNPTEKLKGMLGVVASEINAEAAQHGLGKLVGDDCAIDMGGFVRTEQEDNSGIYEGRQVASDTEEIRKLEVSFSGADKPAVQQFYAGKGVTTSEGIVAAWKKSKENNKNGQMEMAVTALLHKKLKGEFLVVRASTYDDYKNGLDNLILNKRTGEVICAFDEVYEGGEGERTDKKKDKIKASAIKGGVRARYGIGLEEGKLKRTSMDKVPIFYLGLSSDKLMELISAMEYSEAESPVEQEIFSHLIKSLREQKEALEALPLPENIKRKLEQFEGTLVSLERVAV